MTNPQTTYYQSLSIVKLRHQMLQRGLDVSDINHSDEDKNRAVQCLLNDDRRIVAAEVHAMTERRLAKVRAAETETARQNAEHAARKALADAVAHEAEMRGKREAEEAAALEAENARKAELQARKEAAEAALLAEQTLRLRRTQKLRIIRSQLIFDDCLQIMLPPKALPAYRAMKARLLKATGPEDTIIEEIDQFLNGFVTRDFLAGTRCIGGPPEWTVREFERLDRERRGFG
ncbi:hypothetical protein HII31_13070 [Pseudocercospora fuligena]|uniref:Uncharacterized protein n=1 Tax=Pseudocercospora fuligena TaxID=685502 RepID=A0A8H6R6R2_9PEZI|nr:hypothetical protein HII31_13070 [Pseudocercospora fuligena]